MAAARRTEVSAEVLITATTTSATKTAADQMKAEAEIQAAMVATKIKTGTNCTPKAAAATPTTPSKVAATPMENSASSVDVSKVSAALAAANTAKSADLENTGSPTGRGGMDEATGSASISPFQIHLAIS